jgi:hypothetical protein
MVYPRIVRGLSAALLLIAGLDAPSAAQGRQNDTPYVATRLIWRWRGIMNATLEESRAFASEAVTDEMEVFVSPGAVRAVQDRLNEEQLKKADAVVERFTLAAVRSSKRQEDGSRIVDEEAVQAAAKATCPVYPFCPE